MKKELNTPKEDKKNTKTIPDDELEKALNEEDKLVKRIDFEHILINKKKYKIKENYREGLNLELLEERYSDFLEKYDYIVGDMSYGKLRLRGFYGDANRKAPIDMRISSLEDYLLEYCSFGCAYFVLESLVKRNNGKGKTSSHKKGNKQSKRPKQNKNKKKPSNKKEKKQQNTSSKSKKNKKSFTKKDRKTSQANKKETKETKAVKNKEGKTRFQIRKKKN